MLVQWKEHVTLSHDVLYFAIIALVTSFCSAFVSHNIQTWTMTVKAAVPPCASSEKWLDFFQTY